MIDTGENQRGYALVDAIVALALGSLVMASLALVYPIISGSAQRFAGRLDHAEDLRVLAFVAELIRRAQPLVVAAPNGGPRLEFEGTADSIRFVGSLGTTAAVGGLEAISVFREERPDGGARLVLLRRLYRRGKRTTPQDRRVLLDVGSVRFAYLDARVTRSGTPSWRGEWTARMHLPDAIEMRVQLRDSAWHSVVALELR